MRRVNDLNRVRFRKDRVRRRDARTIVEWPKRISSLHNKVVGIIWLQDWLFLSGGDVRREIVLIIATWRQA